MMKITFLVLITITLILFCPITVHVKYNESTDVKIDLFFFTITPKKRKKRRNDARDIYSAIQRFAGLLSASHTLVHHARIGTCSSLALKPAKLIALSVLRNALLSLLASRSRSFALKDPELLVNDPNTCKICLDFYITFSFFTASLFIILLKEAYYRIKARFVKKEWN